MALRRPPLLKLVASDLEDDSLRRSKPDALPSTFAKASISVHSISGDLRLLSSSCKEYKFTENGLYKTAKARPLSGGKLFQVAEKDIEILQPLGEGASSTVYKGYHIVDGKFVAIKRMNCLEREKRRQVMNDIRGLCDVNHPSLVKFIGAFRNADSAQISIVLEYMDCGSLADLTKRAGRLPEAVLASITAQVLEGLVYLHRTRHTVHRDIKPANILLSSTGRAKIADFGISAFVDHTLAVCNTFLGTVTYMSPERIDGRPYSFAADIWSIGLSLLECATGQYPYDASAGPLVLMMQVLHDEVPLPDSGEWSPEFQDFLRECLWKDPLRRPSAEALLSHPFIREKALAEGVCKQATSSLDLRSYLSELREQEIAEEEEEEEGVTRNDEGLEAEASGLLHRFLDSLTAASSSDVSDILPDLSSDVVLVHEGVETRGRSRVLQRLRGLRDLQSALGVSTMTIDALDLQTLKEGGYLALLSGRMRVSVTGPLGSALCGDSQDALFAHAFELRPCEVGGGSGFCICRSLLRLL